jgi:PPOX class probable F420-dependent enzyme
MGIRLSEEVRRLVDGRNYATLATINADGSPQTAAMWVGRDGDELLFSTLDGSLKARNMRRDPRVSVTVMDRGSPASYTEIRGTVTITDQPEGELVEALAQKYLGLPAGPAAPGTVRVTVRVEATKVTGRVT